MLTDEQFDKIGLITDLRKVQKANIERAEKLDKIYLLVMNHHEENEVLEAIWKIVESHVPWEVFKKDAERKGWV